MVKEGALVPALIIGVPVGFVSAAESKKELAVTKIPFITNIGRKGGSAVASSIVNAIMLLYQQRMSNS
jgi:precorrin-8X/cobalt-precorrin-8 methylmutase